MCRMAVNERIDAVRAAEKAQMDAASRKATEAEEAWRRRAAEHRTQAKSLIDEVAEGIGILRSKRERSAQLLGTSWSPIRLAWQPGPGWTAKRREKRREMIGWEVETRMSPQPSGRLRDGGFAAHEVFIPLQGPLQVIEGGTLETIEEHVRAGIVEVPAVDHEKQRTTAEVHADKTVSTLLNHLAQHLALLD
jgi:hypothetical protein